MCSTSGLDEKIKRKAENRKHKRSCNEFSEVNSPSIESSDSAQHNEGNQENKGTGESRQTNGPTVCAPVAHNTSSSIVGRSKETALITSMITSVTWGVETSLCSTVPPEMRLERDCLDDNIVSLTRDMVERGNSVNLLSHTDASWLILLGQFMLPLRDLQPGSNTLLHWTTTDIPFEACLDHFDGVLRNWSAASHHHSLFKVLLKKWLVHLGVALLCSVAYSSAACKNWVEPWCFPLEKTGFTHPFPLWKSAKLLSDTHSESYVESTTISFPPHDQSVLLRNWIKHLIHLHPDLKHAHHIASSDGCQPSDTASSSHSSLSSFAPSSTSWWETFLWDLHVWSFLGHVRWQWRKNHNIYRTQPRIIYWSPPTGRIRIKCKIKNCAIRYRGAVFSVCHPALPWRHACLCNFTTISAANPPQKLFLTLHRRASACSACRGLRGCTSLTRHLNSFHLLIRFGLLIKLQNSCTFTPCSPLVIEIGNDNDNDTLREVHPTSVSGMALQAWVKGSWPREKESVKADGTCTVGKVCTCILLMTVCNHIKQESKKEWVKHKLLLV